MKSASAATLAILSSGQCYRADLWTFTLDGGSVYRYATADVPLTVGGNVFQNNLLIKRGARVQKAGLQVETLDLQIAPQFDAPAGAPQIAGVPFLKACRLGVLDGADVLWQKIFLSNWLDTSPGAVNWWRGKVGPVSAGRQVAAITLQSVVDRLNIAMPRNVYQPGCLHALFDSGCALSKAAFEATGTVNFSSDAKSFNSTLTQADDYFALGTIEFTSGPNAGLKRTVKRSLNSFGYVELVSPLPSKPAVGNTFKIYPGCDKRQATCSSKFSNVLHFRGYPYIPNPETPYDGGAAAAQPAPTSGEQGDVTIGSQIGAVNGPTYVS